jgi:hypothetical protein
LCEFARRREGVTPANVKIRPVKENPDDGLQFNYDINDYDLNEYVDVDLDLFENFHTFDEPNSTFGLRSIFITDAAVENFQFIRLRYHWGESDCCNDYDDYCFSGISVREILFSLDELTPLTPLVVRWRLDSCFTTSKGISFSFEGEQKYFEIIHSNYNGHLYLREFEPIKIQEATQDDTIQNGF